MVELRSRPTSTPPITRPLGKYAPTLLRELPLRSLLLLSSLLEAPQMEKRRWATALLRCLSVRVGPFLQTQILQISTATAALVRTCRASHPEQLRLQRSLASLAAIHRYRLLSQLQHLTAAPPSQTTSMRPTVEEAGAPGQLVLQSPLPLHL